MESWNGTKINKYLAFNTSTEANSCYMELFAAEVAARGYCSRFVLCSLKKNWFLIILLSGKIPRNALFVSGWLEAIKTELLLPTVSSMPLQKKPAIHRLLCHLLNRPPSQCQMQIQFVL